LALTPISDFLVDICKTGSKLQINIYVKYILNTIVKFRLKYNI